VVKPGDSIFAIAGRYKVSQDALMKLNGISDPKKLRIGMKLVIPQS
jgi:LysM repeat protein